MSSSRITEGEPLYALPAGGGRWKRLLILILAPVVVALVLFLILWNTFYKYVPPGKMLVVVSKMGNDLPAGQVLAGPGEKGVQREVLGEGWHFVMPVLYTTEVHPNKVVEPGMVGIVTAKDGNVPSEGRILAEEGERGIRKQVLLPGTYRLNPYGYQVDLVPASKIDAGFVGVLRRRLGTKGPTEFAENDEQMGIIKNRVLQAGIYYVNTEEYEVIPCEIGVYQTSYHVVTKPTDKDTAIKFQSRNGHEIKIDCTIEWEVPPESWPTLLARVSKKAEGEKGKVEHANWETIQSTIVNQNAGRICITRGRNFGTRDFLDGKLREKFQTDFQTELDKVCKANGVMVRSAFIRNIVIPEDFLAPIRKDALAVETRLTSLERARTEETEAEVAEAKQMIEAREKQVKAQTELMVGEIDQQVSSLKAQTEADIAKLTADNKAKVAKLDAERKKLLGAAKADADKMKKTAESSLYKMKMDLFKGDGDAFLRYTLAQQLSPSIRVRLFQSGPGTLWTNMGDKGMNLFMPLPTDKEPIKKQPEEKKP